MPLLSVIIVTYNSAATVGACLRPLVAGSSGLAEIIVVDNHSGDGTTGVITAGFPQVRCIPSGSNRGYAAAVNAGTREASGEYLLILNPDTEADAGFVERLAARLTADPSVALAGLRWVSADGVPQPSAWRLPALMTLAAESFLPFTLSTRLLRCDREGTVRSGFVSGGCLVVRAELFRSLGGFDERYFMYYEDADFCLRAQAAGHPPRLFGDMPVTHHGRGSFHGDLTDFFVKYYRSKLIYCERNFGSTRAAIARLMILTGIAMRIPAYGFVGMFLRKKEFVELMRAHQEAWREAKSKK